MICIKVFIKKTYNKMADTTFVVIKQSNLVVNACKTTLHENLIKALFFWRHSLKRTLWTSGS